MFERLSTVPDAQELIDRAFRRGSKAVKAAGNDAAFVGTAGGVLATSLSSIVRRFPTFEELPEFYYDLVDAVAGVDRLRVSLSRVGWASKQIRRISRDYMRSPRGAEEMRSALGRMASVLRSIDEDLVFLNEAAARLREIPGIDPSLPTIIIAGYPNVGKSSFLAMVTRARPKIASYPFTTQGLIVGHINRKDQKYQIVDTPGLLDRPLSERNEIERQAIAAMRHLRGVVLFLIDPTGHCGYPLDAQLRLLEEIQTWLELPVVVAYNKSDIPSEHPTDGIRISTLTGEGVPEVLDICMSMMSDESRL
ncbi:MAG TPA: NOG1 family protein [Methanothrix sp.]|nr:NOG1 family protein [Methanothrix sp.]HOK57420.1 NOG1 family protein [Methanothrix sp.]HOL42725.1 NOG1 family protein [Methanothrix sp.]HPO87706.1 NOG1 family protein [Methanothrix sp.]